MIGFCETDTNYTLMQGFLHGSLDVLSNGQNDPSTTCDGMSVGIGFTARQATPGGLIHVDDLVECASPDGGTGDGGPKDASGG